MGKNELMQYVEDLVERKEFPEFKAGDTITVHYKIKEGNKERIQNFLRRARIFYLRNLTGKKARIKEKRR